MLRTVLFGLLAIGLLDIGIGQAAEPTKLRTYFGTYTGSNGSQGIYQGELDLKTGQLKLVDLVTKTENPSFLAIHPNHKFLHSVGEVSTDVGGKKQGTVTSFAIDAKTGKLTQLNQQHSQGAGPCHISIDQTGKLALVANYGGGSIAALPISGGGVLGEATAAIQHTGSSKDKGRQEGPHAHSINADPTNRFAMAADLGLDKILIYKMDPASGKLTPSEPAFATVSPGSGPRHFAFHPSGKFAYVCNEMTSGITAFAYDAKKGALTELQTLSTLPDDYKKPGNSTAEIQVHPSGKFVYVSNRGHDSLAIFAIDPATGKLSAVGHQPTGGKTPRNFGIDPTGQFIVACNQGSGTVQAFRVDTNTGKLTASGEAIQVPNPVCVKFLAIEE